MNDPHVKATDDAKIRFLREFLTDTDAPCPMCGYNLRNLMGGRCPECGETIRIQIGLVEPKMAAAIAGLIGLAAGAGLNGLLLIYGCIQISIRPTMGGEFQRFFTVTGIGFVVLGASMGFWLRYWRAIRRQNTGRKRLLILAAWVLTLMDLIIFSLTLK